LVDRPNDALGVREVANALGLAPSSAHRLLTSLVREGLVERTPAGTYSIGLDFMRMAWKATGRYSLTVVAEPVLTQLVERIDETALLTVFDPARKEMMFALSVESRHPLRYVVALNQWVPLNAGASGLAIWASLPPSEREELLTSSLRRLTPRTLVDPAALRAEYEKVLARGYAISHGQRVLGAVGFAAAIFGPTGVIGTVALSIPEQRFDPNEEPALGLAVREAANAISERMGGTPPG